MMTLLISKNNIKYIQIIITIITTTKALKYIMDFVGFYLAHVRHKHENRLTNTILVYIL